jgi:hypothetical protein
MGQDLSRSPPRSSRKLLLQPVNLTQPCKLNACLKSEIKQAQEATEKAKAKEESAAKEMFKLYANLLSINAKYAWNKIIHERCLSFLAGPKSNKSTLKQGLQHLFLPSLYRIN